jgi:hypothetical protein
MPLAVLDPGVTPYAGSAIWMEAHNRNPARARPVEDAASAFDLGRFSAAYALFFGTIAAFAVAVSALAKSASQALLTLIGLWLVAVMIVPRAGAGFAELAHPTPAPDSFFAAMSADLKAQLDPFGKDAEAFALAMAKRYGETLWRGAARGPAGQPRRPAAGGKRAPLT